MKLNHYFARTGPRVALLLLAVLLLPLFALAVSAPGGAWPLWDWIYALTAAGLTLLLWRTDREERGGPLALLAALAAGAGALVCENPRLSLLLVALAVPLLLRARTPYWPKALGGTALALLALTVALRLMAAGLFGTGSHLRPL